MLVTISGVRLRVGEGSVPVIVMVGVAVAVGVAFVSGASESAMNPTQ